MEIPALMRSLKSSILISNSFQMDKTFWGVGSAAVDQSRHKVRMVAQGDGKFGHGGWPQNPSKPRKKVTARLTISEDQSFRNTQNSTIDIVWGFEAAKHSVWIWLKKIKLIENSRHYYLTFRIYTSTAKKGMDQHILFCSELSRFWAHEFLNVRLD